MLTTLLLACAAPDSASAPESAPAVDTGAGCAIPDPTTLSVDPPFALDWAGYAALDRIDSVWASFFDFGGDALRARLCADDLLSSDVAAVQTVTPVATDETRFTFDLGLLGDLEGVDLIVWGSDGTVLTQHPFTLGGAGAAEVIRLAELLPDTAE